MFGEPNILAADTFMAEENGFRQSGSMCKKKKKKKKTTYVIYKYLSQASLRTCPLKMLG